MFFMIILNFLKLKVYGSTKKRLKNIFFIFLVFKLNFTNTKIIGN